MTPPLVTCVLTTSAKRPQFVRQALKYYAHQTYTPRELIVVDDDGDLTVGGKLNLAIRDARGKIVQKLDDDDYYHPEFLEATVSALLARNEPGAVAGCSSVPVLILRSGELKWADKAFAGGTLCFFRELWQRNPFPEVPVGTDQLFLQHATERIRVEQPGLYIYLRHDHGHVWQELLKPGLGFPEGSNVTEALLTLPAYPKPLRECVDEEDLRFYEGLRGGSS